MSHKIKKYIYSLLPFEISWTLQKSFLVKKIKQVLNYEVCMIVYHPTVYTLGAKASREFLRFNFGLEQLNLHKIDRGGQITVHAPGQITLYPVLDLHHYKCDLHWYIFEIEELVITTLQSYEIAAYRIEGFPGVWWKNSKIASVGIKISNWISIHGVGINLHIDLNNYSHIVPCGIFFGEIFNINGLVFPNSEVQFKWKLLKIRGGDFPYKSIK
uniref:lipoyl(octanoyl) transferase n=1 Tax=Gronococcus sybilensis TaxID=3028029 RepID=A0A9Y1MXN1_9RHOD|nr:lipoate biosynthesis protein B [Gronococcus sybilensis]